MKKFLRLACIIAFLVSGAAAQSATPELTPFVRTQMSRLYVAAATTFYNNHNIISPIQQAEFSFVIDKNEAPGSITSSSDIMQNSLSVYSNTAAIVHTHPRTADPRPSLSDVELAIHLGIPNYVLSRNALWVALPNGTTQYVAGVYWKHGMLQLKF